MLLETSRREAIERRRVALRQRVCLLRQGRQGRQVEDGVERLDDGIVVAFGMRHDMRARVGREHEERNADAARQRQRVGPVRQDARWHVIVEAVGLVIGDDDRADDARVHRLADRVIGIGGMVIVALLGGLDGRDVDQGQPA